MALTIRVGGVPEHFNLPWHWALENDLFSAIGLVVEWKSYPAGTGAMCKDLREGKLDLAVILTEGIIADIAKGNPSKILQFHVNSALRWGIHTPAGSNLLTVEDIKGKKIAISRWKSGSHLMALVHARQQGWTLTEDDFVLVENLDGARAAFKEGRAEVFFWEKFTTKFLVDAGEFHFAGECKTPWPSFVVAGTDHFLEEHAEEAGLLLEQINTITEEVSVRKDIIPMLMKKYQLKEADAREWFSGLEWTASAELDEAAIARVVDQLYHLDIIDTRPSVAEICHNVTDDWNV